jgi:toxin-antitoxin system PIN domain toxin
LPGLYRRASALIGGPDQERGFDAATHPSIYRTPKPRAIVEQYIAIILESPAAVALRAGEMHWALFLEMCRRADCRGNLVQDAYLAALAVEHGCKWITTDRDFARFPRLNWRHPLDGRDPRPQSKPRK